MRKIGFYFSCLLLVLVTNLSAQQNHDHSNHNHDHHGHDHHNHDHDHHHGHDHSHHHHGHNHGGCDLDHGDGSFDPAATAIHHIGDGNVYGILDLIYLPLPCILYSNEQGLEFFMSSKLGAGHHGDGHYAYNKYVLHHGNIHRVEGNDFPMGKVELGHHVFGKETHVIEGKRKEVPVMCFNNKIYSLHERTTLDGGMLGGGITSFWDFSITKNVASMMIIALLLFFMFRSMAKSYRRNPDKAPSGLQSWLEPMVVFIRDEVALPFIGKEKGYKFLPLLLCIFFFILGLNLWGQVPFFGGVNATGSLSLTLVLALIVFIIVTINGNKHYWEHIFWMPGVPTFVKFILTPVEVMGMFIKPLTLMLRLAGNITAGHIAILSFIGLIFIFGKSGTDMVGSGVGTALAIPLTLFMTAIELIVAFIQAFVFTLLTASYIGAATEEHHH